GTYNASKSTLNNGTEYARNNKPIPNIVNATMFPIKATPKADMEIPKCDPRSPPKIPNPKNFAFCPPSSPAFNASAVATPGAQISLALNNFESNTRYKINTSTHNAIPAPINIGIIKSGIPNTNGNPIG